MHTSLLLAYCPHRALAPGKMTQSRRCYQMGKVVFAYSNIGLIRKTEITRRQKFDNRAPWMSATVKLGSPLLLTQIPVILNMPCMDCLTLDFQVGYLR